MKTWAATFLSLALSTLVGCNTSILSGAGSPPPAAPPNEGEQTGPAPIPEPVDPSEPPVPTPSTTPALGFAQVQKQVFQISCSQCHGMAGGVNLESYENVVSVLPEIKTALETNTMPPRRKLSAEQRELVLRWIAEGARRE